MFTIVHALAGTVLLTVIFLNIKNIQNLLLNIFILDAVTVVLYNMMQEFNKMEHVPLIEVKYNISADTIFIIT